MFTYQWQLYWQYNNINYTCTVTELTIQCLYLYCTMCRLLQFFRNDLETGSRNVFGFIAYLKIPDKRTLLYIASKLTYTPQHTSPCKIMKCLALWYILTTILFFLFSCRRKVKRSCRRLGYFWKTSSARTKVGWNIAVLFLVFSFFCVHILFTMLK